MLFRKFANSGAFVKEMIWRRGWESWKSFCRCRRTFATGYQRLPNLTVSPVRVWRPLSAVDHAFQILAAEWNSKWNLARTEKRIAMLDEFRNWLMTG